MNPQKITPESELLKRKRYGLPISPELRASANEYIKKRRQLKKTLKKPSDNLDQKLEALTRKVDAILDTIRSLTNGAP